MIVGGAAAVAIEWKRIRIAIAVECLVRDRDCSAKVTRWRQDGLPDRQHCGRGLLCKEEAGPYLAVVTYESPKLVARYLDDERAIQPPIAGSGNFANTVGKWVSIELEISHPTPKRHRRTLGALLSVCPPNEPRDGDEGLRDELIARWHRIAEGLEPVPPMSP